MTTARSHLLEDWHVHSTFSDGAATIEENVEEARAVGLRSLVLVDHVRCDTSWVEEFVEEVRGIAAGEAGLRVSCGVEAKLLDTAGELDLPPAVPRGARVFIADHQVPSPDGPLNPRAVAATLAAGDLEPATVVDWLVTATAGAVARVPEPVVAHLFSVLPKLGLTEAAVSDAQLRRLAAAIAAAGAIVEISERWRCPSVRVAAAMRAARVRLVASTDSHARSTIGRYEYVGTVLAADAHPLHASPLERAG